MRAISTLSARQFSIAADLPAAAWHTGDGLSVPRALSSGPLLTRLERLGAQVAERKRPRHTLSVDFWVTQVRNRHDPMSGVSEIRTFFFFSRTEKVKKTYLAVRASSTATRRRSQQEFRVDDGSKHIKSGSSNIKGPCVSTQPT